MMSDLLKTLFIKQSLTQEREAQMIKQQDNAAKQGFLLSEKRKGQRGFSLIELMIVMIILGLIASLVGPRLFGKLGKAKQKTAKTQIEMLMATLDAYRLDVGSYPTEQEGLAALMKNPGIDTWDGPYLKKEVPVDPWGESYAYRNPGEHGEVDVFSYGADKKSGGEKEDADIGSWE